MPKTITKGATFWAVFPEMLGCAQRSEEKDPNRPADWFIFGTGGFDVEEIETEVVPHPGRVLPFVLAVERLHPQNPAPIQQTSGRGIQVL